MEDDKTGILPAPNEYMKTLLPIVATGRRIAHRSRYWKMQPWLLGRNSSFLQEGFQYLDIENDCLGATIGLRSEVAERAALYGLPR
jgi:hypothetical protein